MAITINLTDLFTALGKAVKWVEGLDAAETAQLTTGKAFYDLLDNVGSSAAATALTTYTGLKNTLTGQKQQIAGLYWSLLSAFVGLPNEYYSPDSNELNKLLRQYMLDNTETIERNTVSVGAWSNGANNVGGPIDLWVFTQRADSPINNTTPATADPQQNEFIYSQDLTLTCIADRFTGNQAGNESLRVEGQDQSPDWAADFGDQGLMGSVTVTSGTGGGNVLANGGLETYSPANTPSSWDLNSGTLAGTHVFSDTSNAYRGTYALKLTLPTTTARGISQTIATRVRPSTTYLVVLKCKSDGAIGTDITLSVTMTGTDYTAGSTETISYASIGTSWTTKSFFWNAPVRVPTDLKMNITLSTTSNTGSVFIDEVILVPVTMFRGMGIAATCKLSADDIVVGDQFTASVTNDYAGKFQTFLARLGFSLPSDASPSISDSLVA